MTHPKDPTLVQSIIDEIPFDGMKIEDSSFLKELEGRQPCPKCNKSRKYFCYTCYVPIAELENRLPYVKLPLKVDIIKHKREIDGKSTAAHAAILAPDDVSVYTYPDVPVYDANTTVLVYPSYKAVDVSRLFESHVSTDLTKLNEANKKNVIELEKGFNRTTLLMKANRQTELYLNCSDVSDLPVKKVVFIDSTWTQSKGIYKDDNIKKLPCVVLQNRISQFWRHQKGSPRWYLATIEAIHQFLLEVHLNMWGVSSEYEGLKNCFSEHFIVNLNSIVRDKTSKNAYNGQYDNLLFFFKHMYELIHEYYNHEMLFAYKRRLL